MVLPVAQAGVKGGVAKSNIILAAYKKNDGQNVLNFTNMVSFVKFNISEDWLRHGTGEMFLPPTHEKELVKYLSNLIERHDQDFVLHFLTVLTKLTPDDWHTLEKISALLQAEQKGSSIR